MLVLDQLMAWRRTGDKPLPKPMWAKIHYAIIWHHIVSAILTLTLVEKDGSSSLKRYWKSLMGNYTLEIYKAKFYLSLYLLLDQHDECWVISEHNCDWVLVCCVYGVTPHDDVTKWKHFPCYWPFVRGIHRSPVNSTRKGQWRGALMLSLIYTWINAWENDREAGDLRRYRAHYDVIEM